MSVEKIMLELQRRNGITKEALMKARSGRGTILVYGYHNNYEVTK